MVGSQRTRSAFATSADCGRQCQPLTFQEISMKNFFTVASIIILGFATANVANADSQAPRTLTVQFGDLNLNNAQGVDALYKAHQERRQKCVQRTGRANAIEKAAVCRVCRHGALDGDCARGSAGAVPVRGRSFGEASQYIGARRQYPLKPGSPVLQHRAVSQREERWRRSRHLSVNPQVTAH
jgi:UrcA family protein